MDEKVIEAIVHDWTCGCGKGIACLRRDGCREAAEQIVAALAAKPNVVRAEVRDLSLLEQA
jgi:hypothetical protein